MTTYFSSSDEPEPIPQPSRRGRLVWALGGLVVSASVLYWATTQTPSRPVGVRHPAVGITLPKVQLSPCAGTEEELTSDQLRGKVTVVNYWGTWCAPCREEFPHIYAMRAKFVERKNFAFVSVCCGADGPDDRATLQRDVEQYLNQNKYELPVHCDPEAKTRIPLSLALKLELFPYPLTVVADRDGVVRGIWTGYYKGDERNVEQLVKKLLAAATEPPQS